MIKRSTWIYLGLLVVVVVAYIVLRSHPLAGAQATPTATSAGFLINQADGTLQSLRVTDNQGKTVRLQLDPNKVWVITEPSVAEADQGSAGAAQSQVGALKIVSPLIAPTDLNTFSLVSPAYTIELTFDKGAQHKIEVGGVTPTGSGYYIRFDSSQYFVVSQDGIDALTNLLKAPPYLATATPAETDTATPAPVATDIPAAETPTVTATP